ncbi:MAG TPA: hypothetical protein VJB87_01890 [Candidatus Nanoarchaeia archaeon]|nr:hypothetical protein [Candidatus Nanoarchaeia archaeon]
MASALGNAIEFLKNFGLFDVILPFLLVFTITFAILEKTKVLGHDKNKEPKKNLDAMVAFAIAFFVVAASNIVQAIQASLPAISMVLLIIVVFMLLMGSIMGQQEGSFSLWVDDHKWAAWTVIVFILIAVVSIFLSAFGQLGNVWGFLTTYINENIIATLALIVLVIVALWSVLKGSKPAAPATGGRP